MTEFRGNIILPKVLAGRGLCFREYTRVAPRAPAEEPLHLERLRLEGRGAKRPGAGTLIGQTLSEGTPRIAGANGQPTG